MDKGVQNVIGLLFMLTNPIGGGGILSRRRKECFMKKTLKILFAFLIAIVAIGSIYAETFEKVELLDDFGDPTGEFYAKAKKDFDGTYKNSNGVSNGNLKWNIKAQNGKKFVFVLKEDGQIKNLSTVQTTADTFEVKVKDMETGITSTYEAFIYKGEEGQYNWILVKDFNHFVYSGAKFKIVISNERGTYNLGELDASDLGLYVFDLAPYNDVMKAFESDDYASATRIMQELKSADSKGYRYAFYIDQISDIAREKGIYFVGMKGPSGGYVFYDCDADNNSGNEDGLISSECGWRYLEAAPADLRVVNGVPTVDSSVDGYSSAPEEYFFGNYKTGVGERSLYVNGTSSYNKANCTSYLLGSGKRNTELLVSAMGDIAYLDAYLGNATTDQYAAKLCNDLEYNGFDDWFLPSNEETVAMYNELKAQGKGSFLDKIYWSSSEYNQYMESVWSFNFESGYENTYVRVNDNCIRPCRAF